MDVHVEFDGDSDIIAATQDFKKVSRIQTKVGGFFAKAFKSTERCFQAGYKEGAARGHDLGMQAGFTEGLKVGCQETVHWGIVQGTIQ